MRVHAPMVLLLACLACSCTRETETRAPAKSEAALLKRQEKDKVFKHGPGSPLPEEEKARFQGLAYYQVNPAYRFKVTLHRYPDPEIVRFATNTEERRQFLRYGYFEFEIQGQKCRLQVYRATDEGEEAKFFIPSTKEVHGRLRSCPGPDPGARLPGASRRGADPGGDALHSQRICRAHRKGLGGWRLFLERQLCFQRGLLPTSYNQAPRTGHPRRSLPRRGA
ncbi:MAG: hypothetical protein DMG10_20425 [Acidobacteria bacterium]|nr:MAG: hypothetical protein DMG10_20425 [Acidobacteriota bacterium]